MATGGPDLAVPPTRYPQAFHNFWVVLRVDNRRKNIQAMRLAQSVRASLRAHAQRAGK